MALDLNAGKGRDDRFAETDENRGGGHHLEQNQGENEYDTSTSPWIFVAYGLAVLLAYGCLLIAQFK
jgi:hypothetical protein